MTFRLRSMRNIVEVVLCLLEVKSEHEVFHE